MFTALYHPLRPVSRKWLESGSFFNERMIADGYAHEHTYDTPYKYQADFKAAEQAARDAQLGL